MLRAKSSELSFYGSISMTGNPFFFSGLQMRAALCNSIRKNSQLNS